MATLLQFIASRHFRHSFGSSDKKRDAGQTTPENIRRFDDILYGDDLRLRKWQLLDVYRPKDAQEGDSLKKLPVIISVHGGAWVYGDKEAYQFYCMGLAQRGFAVVNYSYRLAPEAKYPASLIDTEKVFQWVCDNAQEYGFDTDKVFAVGDSAGGHLLTMYMGALTNESFGRKFDFIKQKPLHIRGVALNCGKYTMEPSDFQMRLLLGGLMPEKGSPEELEILNVYKHITSSFPPAYVMTCEGDFLKEQAPVACKALEQAGVHYEYHCYGSKEKPLWHVFHCDPVLPVAAECNDDECRFFRSLIEK